MFFLLLCIKYSKIWTDISICALHIYSVHNQLGQECLSATFIDQATMPSMGVFNSILVFPSLVSGILLPFTRTIFVSIDVKDVSVMCPSAPTTHLWKIPSSYGPHLHYLRLDGNEIKSPIPMDLMTTSGSFSLSLFNVSSII